MELIPVLLDIKRTGVLTDPHYITKGLEYETQLLNEARSDFAMQTGRPYRDSRKLFQEIFDERGEEYGTTAKGNSSFSGDILEQLDTPTARIINKIRGHDKRIGTYWSSYLYFADDNHIIRPSLNASGTTTGRFSSSDPNLQNVPKEDQEEDLKKEYVIRGSFVPPENKIILSLDYSQLEYRLMVAYANEERVIGMINEGWDSHEAIAQIVGLPRTLAKTVNFAVLYGAGNEKLGKMIGKSAKEASEIKRLYFSRLPKVRQLIRDIQVTAESRGYVKNWLGRKLWLGKYEWAYAMPNHLIQSGGADVCKRAMVELHRQGIPGFDIFLQVHDEIAIYVDKGKEEEIAKVVKIMEDVFPAMNGMRLLVNAKTSDKSWAARDLNEFSC